MPLRVAMLVFGAPAYSVALARALAAECDVHLYFNRHHLALRDDALLEAVDLRCTVHVYDGFRHRDPRNLFVARRVCNEIALGGFDVLHLQEYPSPWFAGAWRRIAQFPTVMTVHDPYQHSGLPWWNRCYQDFMQRYAMRRAGQFIVHGESLRKKLLERYSFVEREQVHVVPIAADSLFDHWNDQVEPRNTDRQSILFFGDARPNKGLDVLLDAENLLRQSHTNYRVLVAGRCAAHGFNITSLDPDAHVEFDDRFIPNSEVAGFFRHADIVVLPYKSATQSAILPLAFTYGKPVVATNVGALGEVITDGETGLLVPPDDPRALADALRRLLDDPDFDEKLGVQGYEYAKSHLSPEAVAKATVDVYQAVIADNDASVE